MTLLEGELLPQSEALVIGAGSQLHDQFFWTLADAGYRADTLTITRGFELIPDVVKTIKQHYKAVFISGSTYSVHDEGAPQIPAELTDGSIPLFGTCYGGQVIAHNNGGIVGRHTVEDQHVGEYGRHEIEVDPDTVIFSGITKTTALQSHESSVLKLPEGARLTGTSNGIIAAFEMFGGRVVATQFHPEVAETDEGKNMMSRFLNETVGIQPETGYSLEKAVEEYLEAEEANIADELLAGHEINGFLSGGVDSSASAAMVSKVAKRLRRENQVNFYYIDTGSMRKEDGQVIDELIEAGIPVTKIDARQRFFHEKVILEDEDGRKFEAGPLTETSDPDIKRRIMGKHFLDIADNIMKLRRMSSKAEQRLLQGTNASDFVESGGHGGSRIKSHHNVSAETNKWRENGWILEPMLGLFKNHVRMAARHYGLSEKLASRQPFPGPGETIRIVDNHNGVLEWPENRDEIQANIDRVVSSIAGDKLHGHYVPITVSGSRGDTANNKHVVVLNGELDWESLDIVSQHITNNVHDVCRVLYAPGIEIDRDKISGPILGTNEIDLDKLIELEEVKREIMEETGIDPYLSQHFVASLGFSLNGEGKPVLALRCFITGSKLKEQSLRRGKGGDETYTQGIAAIPGVNIDIESFNKVISVLQSAAAKYGMQVVYDLTHKPPGTTEFQ